MTDQVVGLLPAAGLARRLGPLPCSKEILPLLEGSTPGAGSSASERLLTGLGRAGLRQVLILLRRGKEDLPAALGDGARFGLSLEYQVLERSESVVETLQAARPWLGDRRAALAFPDILYEPADAVRPLIHRQQATGSPLVLGLFPCDRPDKADMVELAADGTVRRIWIKSDRRDLRLAWGLAVWDRRFTDVLSRFPTAPSPSGVELYPGNVVQRALELGLRVEAVTFAEGIFLDTGTPEDLERARAWVRSSRRSPASF